MSGPGQELIDGYQIRPMVRQDIEALMEVELRCYPIPWPESVFLRELEATWSRIEVVHPTGQAGRLVAHVVYWAVHDELHVLNVAVHPDLRRRGIAQALLNRLLGVCKAERLQYMTLEVRASNAAAIGLYEGFGLKSIGTRKRYYADNDEDAVVMAMMIGDNS